MRFLVLITFICSALILPIFSFAAEQPRKADIEFFEKEVRPILVKRCYECHGAEKQESDLRLDSRETILQGSASGEVVNLDDPESSLLLRAINYQDEDYEMPPEGKMPDKEIAAITKWIKLGLPWPKEESKKEIPLSFDQLLEQHRAQHWAFQPIENPQSPTVQAAERVSNEVDHFILSKLEEKQLSLSAEADRRTLIRRVTFDLHGLPPTYAEVQAFVKDESPDAYEKLIDRLLASPRYGQQWGRHWLDVARYADTLGYQPGGRDTRYPYAYTYRDYVVDALNQDLPYDQFVKEQLAADYYVGPDDPKLAALGFIRVGRKYLNSTETIDDRIDAVMRGFQAMTVSCARCHNHKYDAISQANYYGLYGVFTSIESHEPLIGKPEETPGYDQYKQGLEKLQADIAEFDRKLFIKIQKETRTHFTDYLMRVLSKKPNIELAKLPFAEENAKDIRDPLLQRWRDYISAQVNADHSVWSPWHFARSIPEPQFAEKFSHYLDEIASPVVDSKKAPLNALLKERLLEVKPKTMPEFANVYGSLFKEITAVWVKHGANDQAIAKLTNDQQEMFQAVYQAGSPLRIPQSDVRRYSRRDENGKRQPLLNKVVQHEANAHGSPKRAMAVKDLSRPKEPVIFIRGDRSRRGDRVPRQFLNVLATDNKPVIPFQQGSGRLELAEHIIDPANPLTARVIVNRVWLHHFDQPLVNTPSDFGVRSDPPTHPQLLDHLASYFKQRGWSLKKLHKHIMMSSVYRQASVDRPDARQIDPANQLYWKMNRRRLSFEEIRDAILATTGHLDDAVGGKPVRILTPPYPKRRTLYGYIDRQDLPNLYRVFDFPNPDATSPQRSKTTVPQQALYFLNNQFVIEHAKAFAKRTFEQHQNRDAFVDQIYQAILQREPTEQEKQLSLEFIEAAVKDRQEETKLGAVHQLTHALLQSNEFLFID